MPLLRTQWTELVGSAETSQWRYKGVKPRCGDFELNAMECLEAYGYFRGERHCKDYIDDFNECVTSHKSMRRVMLMRRERLKQVATGERKVGEGYWGPLPNRDSFQHGPFQP